MDLFLLLIAICCLNIPRYHHWFIVIVVAFCCKFFSIFRAFDQIPFLIPTNLWDGALILLVISLLTFKFKVSNKHNLRYKSLEKYVIYFLAFVTIIGIVDLIISINSSFIDFIKISRHWYLLLYIFVFPHFSKESIRKAITIIFYIVSVLSVDMVIESLTSIYILTPPPKMTYTDGILVMRGAFPIPYSQFFIISLIAGAFNIKNKYRWPLVFFLIGSCIVSITRSVALGILLFTTMYYFLLNRNNLKSIFYIFLIGLFAFLFINFIPGLGERFLETKNEFAMSSSGEVEGSATFRLLLTKERINYLMEDAFRFAFGIGNISENNFPNIFHIGLIQENGIVAQTYSGDIAWPNLFLRLGFWGTLLYLILIFGYLRIFTQNSHYKLALGAFCMFSVNIFFNSFSSSNISTATFWVFPLLIGCYMSYKKEYNEEIIL